MGLDRIRPLDADTFPAWLALAQKHDGVWGGCYCSYFHADTDRTAKDGFDRPTFKRRLVEEGVAHAALVFDGDDAIAWCEYGSPAEVPNIHHRKEYDAGESRPAPWRITCFFVDRDHRRAGVAREALDGALHLIGRAGGGEVVSFPNEPVPGKATSSSFLHNGTRSMFEKAGFTFERRLGKRKTVMRIVVPPAHAEP
ncbi:GNAT family N-acetyltransferase [Amnibacterium setariae]|uniref:GNAT family N-acetyltransferase n=1 Tax=Amnibacterium setariae TaxID=2306585 RepID=A0A3A1U1T0_9MICO|nr:GNAT family N-acetyltransferase [Amnibacterium setariae]RIX30875.1 GNAT family N-acetyltransferase [Amnibacterium setariae]